ncbi:hypothetical protein K502DRAFT_6969 [Neoconidiobolus thromboides FSU 785]|nr:hypothetical protein K502DRAFT_6969 [Neoconidiobolus thromboides FSU 785]
MFIVSIIESSLFGNLQTSLNILGYTFKIYLYYLYIGIYFYYHSFFNTSIYKYNFWINQWVIKTYWNLCFMYILLRL